MTIDQQPSSTPGFVIPGDRKRLTHLGAAALAVIGTLMPWVSVLFFSASGSDVDGGLPFWVAAIGLAAIVFRGRIPWANAYRIVSVAAPLYVAGEAVYVLARISTYAPDDNEFFELSVSPQPGLFLTIAAAGTCLVIAAKEIMKDRAAAKV